ncbi:MAG: TauD/TfdA family dioxygenase [Alphaproteobacteria bacterium]|nr:TauD/TfdA family dioxygenase [Alphaproteobacteria bacterium]
MDITPCEATLGATITGVDLAAKMDDATFGIIEAAWYKYGVLIFPEQSLSNEAHIAFSRRFGELERSITKNRDGYPEIIMLSNVKRDGGLWPHESEHGLFLKGNTGWHTDSSFKRVPSMASLLAAHRVPDTGGGTEYADMRAAYDALEPAMQAWLEDKVAVHSYMYSQGLVGGLSVLSEAEQAALPPVEHALIRSHPKTGRKNLYLGRHASHILGQDEGESRALLQKLCDDACQPPRTTTHYWSAGDVVIWDNRCVLHRGQTWPGDQTRVMARTTIAGEAGGNEWAL